MADLTRRDFMKLGLALAASFGLGPSAARVFADGLQGIFSRQKRVLWLQAQACSGCSVSLLNSEQPDIVEVLTGLMSLVFHPTLSAAQGQVALDAVRTAVREGRYVLVLEGAIPGQMPEACVLGHDAMGVMLPEIIRGADYVVAVGSCASFGGIPAAEGNPTGAVSVREFMRGRQLPTDQRLINCPGCPTHPESVIGTLAYVTAKGYPEVDPENLCPLMFYRDSVHDDCPYFHYWQKQEFAAHLGEKGCLFKLGCLGPLSRTRCPTRQWNGGVNWCIRAGAPCNACTSPEFAKRRSFPFYRLGERHHAVEYTEQEREGRS